MYLKRTLLATMVFMLAATTYAQQARTSSGKLPAARTEAEKQLSIVRAKQATQSLQKTGSGLPDGIRYPGEFEESQSVVISWSYEYDVNGNVLGADVVSEYAEVSANLAAEIQKVVPVIIRITKGSDSTDIKSYMTGRGTPLSNYTFMIAPGEDWWTRDFGPNGVYVGEADSLAFIDLKYYDGRDQDNAFPITFANMMGVPNYVSRMHAEGGNLMADGFGGVFFSDVITSVNTDPDFMNPAWTKQQTLDSITALFGGKQLFNLKTLLCDGGTGHIDLYIKMIDEQTLMVAEYPQEITAADKQKIEDNLQYIVSFNSTYGRPFRVYRIPHPTDDSGQHTKRSCFQLNSDARTFVNGLTVNNTYIMPSYSNATSGNKAQTEEVRALMKKIMPGYKVPDIDSRLLSVLGGEIHCITMQIPADNPVLFWHPSVDGYKNIFGNQYHIIAKITNRSGIAQAKCMWRIKGNPSFNTLDLTDSSGYFVGDIVAGGLTPSDEIEYYLTAETNNGKTAVKPITAPEGFYSIYFNPHTALEQYQVKTRDYLFNAYPNPASSVLNINFYAENGGNASISISDIAGKQVKLISNPQVKPGLNEVKVSLDDLNNGIYFYTYSIDGNIIATRKVIVSK